MRSTKSAAQPDVELKPWQVAGAKLMVSQACAGMFMDPGLGKTLTTLAAFDILRSHKAVRTMLVVAPLRPAYQVWPAEVAKWKFDYSVTVLHGAKKAERLQESHDIYVINYEGLEWLFAMMNRLKLRFDMVVFDESSMLRNTQTKRFKQVKQALNLFKRRYILTGTPVPKGLENLFGQVYVLDGGKALGAFITHFRREFFDQDPYTPFPKFSLKPGATDKIYERVAPLVYRADESVLDLPKKVEITREVALPKGARLIYEDVERDLISQIEDHVIYASNAGVATGKLRQIANGGIYLTSGEKDWKKVHDVKTEHTLELLEELEGKPTLVAYEFHHDMERLLSALGKDTPFIGGGITPRRAAEIEAAWNRGEIERMLVQPASAAFGLNLQAGGRALIWHSLTWNWEHYDQLIRRIYRQGQRHRVFNYHLVAKDTVDEAIMAAMTARGGTQKDMFNALLAYLNKRRKS